MDDAIARAGLDLVMISTFTLWKLMSVDELKYVSD